MKTSIILIISLYFLATFSYAQNTEEKQDEAEENIIDLPFWFSDTEKETIQKIEAQDTILWSDYVQLAISYAQLNAVDTKIEALIRRALKENTSDSCKMLSFILENKKDWNITKKYGEIVYQQIINYGFKKQ